MGRVIARCIKRPCQPLQRRQLQCEGRAAVRAGCQRHADCALQRLQLLQRQGRRAAVWAPQAQQRRQLLQLCQQAQLLRRLFQALH